MVASNTDPRTSASGCEPSGWPSMPSAFLDIAVQDSGPDCAKRALVNRGVDISGTSGDEVVRVWTMPGAPNLRRRANLPFVGCAVEPFSDAQGRGHGGHALRRDQAGAKGGLSIRPTTLMAPCLRFCGRATPLTCPRYRSGGRRCGRGWSWKPALRLQYCDPSPDSNR